MISEKELYLGRAVPFRLWVKPRGHLLPKEANVRMPTLAKQFGPVWADCSLAR